MKDYLPIGSVVLVKEANKKVMIVGINQKQVDTGAMWDYSACLYPEGVLDPQKLYLFNNEQIDSLYFIGFQDTEGLAFRAKLKNE